MSTRPPQLSASQTIDETRWTHGARIILVLAILFVALNAMHIVYRFTIPSIGWEEIDPETLDEKTPYFELISNVIGAPSALMPKDIVEAFDGVSADTIMAGVDTAHYFNLPGWRVGGMVALSVLRDGQRQSFEVPLVHWTAAAWLRTNFGNFNELLEWFITLLVFGAGAFTFFKRPGTLSARFLFAFGLANLSITLSDSIPDYIALYFDPPAGMAKVFFSNIVFAYLLAPSFLGFALTFPRPKALIQRQPRWLLLPYLIGSMTIVLLFTVPELATIGFLLTFAMLLLGVIALIHSRLTMHDAVSRAQMRWAVGGVTAGAAVFMLNFLSNAPPPYREIILTVANLGLPIIGFSLAIAILRYRLYDIDIIIRRTLQYTLLTALLALVYFGSILLLQTLVENYTGDQSPFVIVFSTLTIAALFNPLRIRIQDFIDRRFYRAKYDAEQTLAQFAAVARDEVDMDKLAVAMLNAVGETVQPEQISLWLQGKKP